MFYQKRKISPFAFRFDDTRFIKDDRRKFVDRPHLLPKDASGGH